MVAEFVSLAAMMGAALYVSAHPLPKRYDDILDPREYDFSQVPSYKIQGTIGREKPQAKRRYAMMITGTQPRHHNTGMLVLEALLDKGYQPEDIWIFEGSEGNPKYPCAQVLPSAKRDVRDTFNYLRHQITPDDSFFFFLGTHANKKIFQDAHILLENKSTISEPELEEMVGSLQPNYSLLYFNSCFGGNFAKRLGVRRRIAIASCLSNKFLHSNWTARKEEKELERIYGAFTTLFTLHFFAALRGMTPDGKELGSSVGTIESAFDYASQKQWEQSGRWFFRKNTPLLIAGEINAKDIEF